MSSGFITEAEIVERRRVRQEQWDKVRTSDQPTEVPEEEYDHRSLYERLQANKQKRDLEYEEAHRLKNMIKGLDDDEVEFLDLVDRSKLEEERKKSLEEAREMAEFRNKVASLQEESFAERIQMEIQRTSTQQANHKPPPNNSKSSQSKLLAGAVVKKRTSDTITSSSSDPSPSKKLKFSSSETDEEKKLNEGKEISNSDNVSDMKNQSNNITSETQDKSVISSNTPNTNCKHIKIGGMTCIGILPGLGHYRTESSDEFDSDDSSDDDPVSPVKSSKFDLVGRKIKKKSSDAD